MLKKILNNKNKQKKTPAELRQLFGLEGKG